jgi:hypothetical protein
VLIGIERRTRAVPRDLSFDRSVFVARGVSEGQSRGTLASGHRCGFLDVSWI